jgi:excisionase family DNA binding protein
VVRRRATIEIEEGMSLHTCSPFLDTTGVAGLLGIAVRTVSLWAECGEIPAFKMGRQWRFRRESIMKWVKAAEQKSVEIPLCSAEGKQPTSKRLSRKSDMRSAHSAAG